MVREREDIWLVGWECGAGDTLESVFQPKGAVVIRVPEIFLLLFLSYTESEYPTVFYRA